MVDWLDTAGEVPKGTPGGAPKWVVGIIALVLVLVAVLLLFS
jgi:hypothetical protein